MQRGHFRRDFDPAQGCRLPQGCQQGLDEQILKQTQALKNNRAKNDDEGEKSTDERSEIFVEDEDNELLTDKLKNEVDMVLAEINVLKKGVPEGGRFGS